MKHKPELPPMLAGSLVRVEITKINLLCAMGLIDLLKSSLTGSLALTHVGKTEPLN